jgi:hypothetical protein
MSCECYPPERGYPKACARGCNGFHMCWVLAEMKNPQLYRDRYFAELRKRGEELSGTPQPEEMRYRLSKLGVPANALALACSGERTLAIEGADLWWRMDHQLCPMLVLTSAAPGTGKTTAAAWVALEWGRRWGWNEQATGANTEPFVWLDGPRLKTLSGFDEATADLLAGAATARLLVVDDAGREGNRPAMEALSDVLQERVDRNRLTVLTTNQRGEQFRARYGEPLADRLRARAHVVDLKELKSMRKPSPVFRRSP